MADSIRSSAASGSDWSINASIQRFIEKYGPQAIESIGIGKILHSAANYILDEVYSSETGLHGRVYSDAEYVVRDPTCSVSIKIPADATDQEMEDEISWLTDPKKGTSADLAKFVKDLKAFKAAKEAKAEASTKKDK
jgi:hypothetical protein